MWECSVWCCGEREAPTTTTYLSSPQPEPEEEEEEEGPHLSTFDCSSYFLPLYSCALCGEQFTEPVALQLHLLHHHGRLAPLLRPALACARCPAAFYSIAVLRRHVLTHHV